MAEPFFGDPTPWRLGWPVIHPSLVLRLVFGLVVGRTAEGFVARVRRSR